MAHRIDSPGRPTRPLSCAGLVFIDDAHQTPCPAAGTGINRLLTDVQKLTAHAKRWSEAGDFSAARLAAFYGDPVKRQMDDQAIHDAMFRRGISANPALIWSLHWGKMRLRQFAECMAHAAKRSLGQQSGGAWMPPSPTAPSALRPNLARADADGFDVGEAAAGRGV